MFWQARKVCDRSTQAESMCSRLISILSGRRFHRRNHTLKHALTDPRFVSGIGNAYSDEILRTLQLSPMAQTQKLKAGEWERLFAATRDTLEMWVERLRSEAGDRFPEKVTAFQEDMAVHGRYSQPCPVCGEKVLRIRYADNETNYCARCQTGGKVLADQAGLSRRCWVRIGRVRWRSLEALHRR